MPQFFHKPALKHYTLPHYHIQSAGQRKQKSAQILPPQLVSILSWGIRCFFYVFNQNKRKTGSGVCRKPREGLVHAQSTQKGVQTLHKPPKLLAIFIVAHPGKLWINFQILHDSRRSNFVGSPQTCRYSRPGRPVWRRSSYAGHKVHGLPIKPNLADFFGFNVLSAVLQLVWMELQLAGLVAGQG